MNEWLVKNNSNKDDVIGFSIVDKTEDPTFFTGFLNDITKLESGTRMQTSNEESP